MNLKKPGIFLAALDFLLMVLALIQILSFPAVEIEFSSDSFGTFELFHGKDFRFSAKKRISRTYDPARNRICFRLINKKSNTIRLDPSLEKNTSIKIAKIVYYPNIFMKKEFSAGALAKCPMTGIQPLKSSARKFYFRTINNDPQILIALKEFGPGGIHIPGFFLLTVFLILLVTGIQIFRWKKPDRSERFLDILREKRDAWKRRFPFLSSTAFSYFLFFLLFCIGTGTGFTLSNLGSVRNHHDIILKGEQKLLGQYRAIRSDEYMAHGLLPAIDQYNHTPKFPLINRNKGLSGRNYLILHDTGAPVRHISILGRPAVWGYFLFDLRKGISWHSLFPVFFSIFAFWFLLDTLCPLNGKWNFLFAFASVFVSTSAMWSFWPAYNCSGTFLALAAMIRLLQSKDWKPVLFWGVLAGWAASVSALTIYFPRIWPGVLLSAFLLIAWIVENPEKVLPCKWRKICGILLCFLVIAFLLYEWYDAVKDQISIVLNSVYPGKRLYSGRTLPPKDLFIGWFSPVYTGLNFKDMPNDSEAQMPMLILSLFPLVLFSFRSLNKKFLIAASTIFLCIVLYFVHIGFPAKLAEITLFARCPEFRFSYIISVAILLLCAFLFSQKIPAAASRPILLFSAGAAALLPLLLLTSAPISRLLKSAEHQTGILCILVLYLFISFTILFNHKTAIAVYLLFCIVSGLFFNPLCIAPRQLKVQLLEQAKKEQAQWKHDGRTLFLGSMLEPNLYAAAGGKSLNGHFIPEDLKLYELLLKDLPDPEQFHRQNHFYVIGSPGKAPPLRAYITAYPGAIYVEINPEQYDFSEIPIDYAVSFHQEWIERMKRNKTLEFLGSCGSRARFRVKSK